MAVRRYTATPEVGPFNAYYTRLAEDADGILVLREDVAEMIEALRQCQQVLAMMIAPAAIQQTTVAYAYAQAVEAEAKARALIGDAS